MADKNSYLLAKKIIEEFESEFTEQSSDKKLIEEYPFSKRLRNIIELVNNNEILGYPLVTLSDVRRAASEDMNTLKGIRGFGNKTLEELKKIMNDQN